MNYCSGKNMPKLIDVSLLMRNINNRDFVSD